MSSTNPFHLFVIHHSDSFVSCYDSDDSGTITYDEFKSVFNANIGPDSIPFDFDWYAAHATPSSHHNCVR